MSDTSEEFLSDDEIGVRDGNGKSHDIVKIVGFNIAVPVRTAANDELKTSVVSGELHKEVVEPVENSVAGDDSEDIDVHRELFGGLEETRKDVVPEAFDDPLFVAFLISGGDVLALLPYRCKAFDLLDTFLFVAKVGGFSAKSSAWIICRVTSSNQKGLWIFHSQSSRSSLSMILGVLGATSRDRTSD